MPTEDDLFADPDEVFSKGEWGPELEAIDRISPDDTDEDQDELIAAAIWEGGHAFRVWRAWCRRAKRFDSEYCRVVWKEAYTVDPPTLDDLFGLPSAFSVSESTTLRRVVEAPMPEWLSDHVAHGLPQLAPTIIDGVLRRGHKMLLAGGSKASKSFALIELALAISEGGEWLGWQCAQGRVLHVDLELDRASCLHRFEAVRRASAIEALSERQLIVWSLRGKVREMGELLPDLAAFVKAVEPSAVIIDPAYKVLDGDENSAEAVSAFARALDGIAELGPAVIYSHHHSKGSQGYKKSMDRASGSGVFARDVDALLDLIELEGTDEQALRIEGTLREFRAFSPKNVWFRYPIHVLDADGALGDLRARGQRERSGESRAERKQKRAEATENAFEACQEKGSAALAAIAEKLGVTDRAARTRVNAHGGFEIENAIVCRKGGEVK